MSSSPISRSARQTLLLLIPLFLCSDAARALDPNRTISQYIHDQWDAKRGFPAGSVHAIAQTPDGYLWIGAENGLVRFDGATFRLFDHANSPALPGGPVLGLVADVEGALWIRMQEPFLLRYHGGVFQEILPVDSNRTEVTALGRGIRGEVLLGRSGNPMSYSGGQLTHFAPPGGTIGGLVISVAETQDGTVWIGNRDVGLFALRRGVGSGVDGLPDRKVNSLLAGAGQELWIGTDNGLIRWNGKELTRRGVPPTLLRGQILTLAGDRDSNVWASTPAGIVRIDSRGTASIEPGPKGRTVAVHAIYEDREGELWFGGTNGLERYRDTVFLNYPEAAGHKSQNSGSLYGDVAGRTWLGPSAGGLVWLKGAERHEVLEAGLERDVVYSITGGTGEIWVGRQHGGLTQLRENDGAFQSQTYTIADGLARGSVYALHRTRDGTLWAGTLNGGVSQIRNGRVTTFTTANGLASDAISAIEETADGTVWLATANGLQSFADGHWRTYGNESGLPPAPVNCLLDDSGGVLWVGTGAGLAFIRDGRVFTPRDPPESLQGGILGMADDGRGNLWLATERQVVSVSRAALLGEASGNGVAREFGVADGIPATEGLKRDHSVIKDQAGRIWFSLQGGLCMVDPARLVTGAAPALVHLEGVSVDGRPLDLRMSLRFRPNRQRIAFDYTGLSLAAPERVRYRYRLDGYDHTWSAPGDIRQAVYTNLEPASYTFRVIASNGEGLWNGPEAQFGFEIVPHPWQTWWFLCAGVLISSLAIVAIYRFRLHRVSSALHMRFEERLAERTRIARELHDTLLQGFISASMQVHVAAEALPDNSNAKPTLTRALQLMQQVIEESRNTVRGLRSTDAESLPLETALSRIREELGPYKDVEYRVIVEGHRRLLRSLLRDEVYRIGREALMNAFRHSGAKQIELELKYSATAFQLFVRDDGSGIDGAVLDAGREGHWGIVGMRERAEQIGARLHVYSRSAAGTEIELDVPAHLAYRDEPGGGRRWMLRLRRSRRKIETI